MKVDGFEIFRVRDTEGLSQMLKKLQQQNVLYLDTETSGLDPYTSSVLLVQMMGGRDKEVFVIEVTDSLKAEFSVALNSLLTGKEIVMHNASFDLKMLSVHFGIDIESLKVFDTMLAESVLCAGVKANLRSHTSLKKTVQRRTGVVLDKEIRDDFIGKSEYKFTKKQIEYAARDVIYMPDVRKSQVQDATKYELLNILRLEFELVKHVARMELNGVYIDSVMWQEFMDNTKTRLEDSYSTLVEKITPHLEQAALFDEIPFNINSTTQLLDFLNNNLGLSLPDTAEITLKSAHNDICDSILEYRENEKLLSAFGSEMLKKINPITGRVHAQFNQCATSTGRFSSDRPNLQQIPSKGYGAGLRKCFRAAKGCKLICADYSQIELRILAEMSEEPVLLDAYKNEADIHTETATIAFGIPAEEVTPDQRKIAKVLSFATVYGGGAFAISKGITQVISEEEAEDILRETFGKSPGRDGAYISLSREFVDSYFKGIPRARDLLEELAKEAINNRYSRTPLGRKRFYDDELEEAAGDNYSSENWRKAVGSVERKGKNHPIQGCSADITKMAIVRAGEEFHKLPWKAEIVMQVHDELVCEVDAEHAEEAEKILLDSMIWAGRHFIKKVDVKVDSHISEYWEK